MTIRELINEAEERMDEANKDSNVPKVLFYHVSNMQPHELYLKMDEEVDEETLRTMIKEIIANNKEQQEAYLNGRSNLFDYFVGQVMKQTRGKADPSKAAEIIKNELEVRK